MKLSRGLIVLDLETTGTWVERDKIVEIGMVKCFIDGTRECYSKRVNPGIIIPENVSQIIGISNEDVKDCSIFRNIAGEIVEFIGDSDIAGFNIERFDLPILKRELSEAGIQFEKAAGCIIDAQKVFHIHEKRDLTAALKFYCNKEIIRAHSALDDAGSALEVLEEQVIRYGNGQDYVDCLKIFDYDRPPEFFGRDKKFRWWNGSLYPIFGKYGGKYSVNELLKMDRPYLEWILVQDFSEEVKLMIKGALSGMLPKK